MFGRPMEVMSTMPDTPDTPIPNGAINPFEPGTIADEYVGTYDPWDTHRRFTKRTGSSARQIAYERILTVTTNEQLAYENHRRTAINQRRAMHEAAGLIEYWYRTTPDTQMYRHRDAETLLMSIESSRAGALWARAQFMYDEQQQIDPNRDRWSLCEACKGTGVRVRHDAGEQK